MADETMQATAGQPAAAPASVAVETTPATAASVAVETTPVTAAPVETPNAAIAAASDAPAGTSDGETGEETASAEDENEEGTESETGAEVTATPEVVAPAKSTEPKDERPYEMRLPYEWDQCIRVLSIQIWPPEGEGEARAFLAATTHNDLPVTRQIPLSALGPLPAPLQEILDALKADLPSRAARALQTADKKKQDEAERQKKIEESKARSAARVKTNAAKKDEKKEKTAAKPKETKAPAAKPEAAPGKQLTAEQIAQFTPATAPAAALAEGAAPAKAEDGMTQASMF